MAWCWDDCEAVHSEVELLSVLKGRAELWERRVGYFHAHDRLYLEVYVVIKGVVGCQGSALLVEVAVEISVAPHVVEVEMGVEQMDDVEAVYGEIVAKLLPLAF